MTLFRGIMAGIALLLAVSVGAQGTIPTATVRRGDLVKTISTIGQLQAAKSAVVMAPYEGKVTRVVPEGTRVEANDPVLWLDTESLNEELKEQLAALELAKKDLEAAQEEYRLQEMQNGYNLESEQANVQLAEQRLADAERNFETERILVERNISARTRLDEAQLSLNQAAVQLRGARIDLQKLQENLASNLRVKQTKIDKAQLEVSKTQDKVDELQDKIEGAVLYAPVAGEVSYFLVFRNGSRSKVQEGDTVWARSNLLEIPDRSQMLAIVPVNELDIAEVEAGQPVEVILDALPGGSFKGTVERKSIVPIENANRSRDSSATGPREFEVRIRMLEQNDQFFQGMTASARIEVAREEGVLLVPLEAITLHDDKFGVHVASGASSRFEPLEVKLTNNLHAGVAGDLEEGAAVYLRDPNVSRDEARRLSAEALKRVGDSRRAATRPATMPAPDAGAQGAPQAGGEEPRMRGPRPGNPGGGT